jgi:uncharacterized protein (DUF433 family)
METDIIRDPKIMNGKPIIKNTRITVELILKKLSEGASHNDLIEMYPNINSKNILDVLEYAAIYISNEELIEL